MEVQIDALRKTKAEIEDSARCSVGAFTCDVTKAVEIQAAFGAVIGRLGRVDIVVNNAGSS